MFGLILLLFTFFGIIYFLGQIDLTYLEDESEKFWEREEMKKKKKSFLKSRTKGIYSKFFKGSYPSNFRRMIAGSSKS